MVFSLQVTQARQCSVGLAQQGGSYRYVVDYCLQAAIGGKTHDLLLDGGQQRLSVPVPQGKPMLTPPDIAALIRADCQQVFGAVPDHVVIDGTPS